VNEVGAAKSEALLASGPVPALRTQYLEIKYRKPTPGGRSKVRSIRVHVPVALSFADFFSASRDFQNACLLLRGEFTNPIKGPWVNRVRIRVFISLACWPGGGQKSGGFDSGPVAKHTNSGANFRKHFLSDRSSGKSAAKFSGGGVGDGRWH
jgi:hypothetical protein